VPLTASVVGDGVRRLAVLRLSRCMIRSLVALACLIGLIAPVPIVAAPIDWWNVQRRGGNSFNAAPPDQRYFNALAGYGGQWVRLTYDKWKPERRDFLIGSVDKYEGLVQSDLSTLRATLDHAHAAGLKVVIAPLSLPGLRWKQNNGGVYDGRLWNDKAWWLQSQAFWRDLAQALKGHPAIAGFNIVNEPTPELGHGLVEHPDPKTAKTWYAAHRGTAQDLPLFYQGVIDAIRQVDFDTPIMLDAGWYGAADGFAYWPTPLEDRALIYAFHMYEPYDATSGPNLKRNPRILYPGTINGKTWDAAAVATYLGKPLAWADGHGIPRNRVVAGEFGCMRQLPFCATYLDDVLNILEPAGVHWAFYSFREDVWDGMDYELGGGAPPPGYWDNPAGAERGLTPQLEPIVRRLKRVR